MNSTRTHSYRTPSRVTLAALGPLAIGLALGVSTGALAQFEVGNGGDAVHCIPRLNAEFVGYYALDYVATFDHESANADILAAETPLESIRAVLEAKFPALGQDLAAFLADAKRQIYKQPDYVKPRIWVSSGMGLIDLKDESLIERLPSNCYRVDDLNHVNVLQAVIQESRTQAIMYKYDPAIMKELEKAPLQWSFILLHEWLWKFAPNAGVVRDANRFLHLKSLAELPADDIRLALKNIGLLLERLVPPTAPVVHITEAVYEPGYVPVVIKADAEFGTEITFVNETEHYAYIHYRFEDGGELQMDILGPKSGQPPLDKNTRTRWYGSPSNLTVGIAVGEPGSESRPTTPIVKVVPP